MERIMSAVGMREARTDDLPRLQKIRRMAFEPVFASFRAMLGDELYERVQAREDEAQAELLPSLLTPESGWEVHVAELDGTIVGFVTFRMDPEAGAGEIGLNAVHPDHAGHGLGTGMYEFVLARMKAAGLKAATVATGADPSHAAARQAYRKAGFLAEVPSVWMCRKL